jgi:hypothetical protein
MSGEATEPQQQQWNACGCIYSPTCKLLGVLEVKRRVPMKIVRVSLWMILASGLCGAVLRAQEVKDAAAAAPIPAQILTGKRVFISNAGVSTTGLTYYVAAHTGGANGLYNEFYAAMKNWGRYELMAAPADADLVFEIDLSRESPGWADPDLGLRILDAKTHFVLWKFVEKVPAGSGRPATRRKAWEKALAKLVDDVKEITEQTRP